MAICLYMAILYHRTTHRYNENFRPKCHKIPLRRIRKGVQFVYMQQISVLLQRTALWALGLAGGFLFLRYLLEPLLPFLLALGLSAMVEPQVQRLRRAIGVKRTFAAATVTTALLLVAGSAAAVLALRLILELRVWSTEFPQALERFPLLWNGFLDRIESWYSACPAFFRSALDLLAEQLAESAPTVVGAAGQWLMGTASDILSALPNLGLFLVTTVLAVYFTSLSYPAILSFLKRQLPPSWQKRCRAAAQCFRSTILKWLRAEALLLLSTFLILLGGFAWMGLDFALLAAVFIALVDALPVLGTGTVLLPWSAGCLLLGDTGQALRLLLLYALTLLSHTLLEPRLLAGQVGLPPITALLAMYLGFHFVGVGGMILLPILLLLLKQLQDAGVVRLWKA